MLRKVYPESVIRSPIILYKHLNPIVLAVTRCIGK